MSIKKILINGCVFYTITITAFYTFGLLAENSTQWIPTLRIAYSLLAFSMCFSAVNEVVGALRLGFVPRMGIHFAVNAVLFYLIFVLGGGFHTNGGSTLAAMLCYVFVYAIGAVIAAVLRYLFADTVKAADKAKGRAKEIQEPEEYKSLFQKKD